MRVPVLDSQQVATRPLSLPNRQDRTPDVGGPLAQGLGQFAQGAEHLGTGLEKAIDRADAVKEADALTEYERATTARLVGDSQADAAKTAADGEAGIVPGQWGMDLAEKKAPGFLSTRGQAASAASADTLDALEKDRQKIAQGLNDRQKERFLAKSRGMFEDTRRRVEGHVAGQMEQAVNATVRARTEQALTSIANSYTDEELAAKRSASVEDDLRRLALSKEDGDAKVAAFREAVTSTRLNQYLAEKDWKGAEALFAKDKATLGEKAPHFAKVIGTLKEDQQAEHDAGAIIEAAKTPAGRVDEGKVNDFLEQVPEQRRKEVMARVERGVVIQEKAWNQRVSRTYDSALSSYIKGGLDSIDTRTKVWLIDNAPEQWAKIQSKARSDANYYRARARGEKHPETDEQREALIELQADLVENPERYADMSPQEFTELWGHRLSPAGLKEGGRKYVGTKKGDQLGASEFSRFLTNEVKSNPVLKGKGTADKFKAFMGQQRDDFVAQHKREPTVDEAKKMKDAAFADVVEQGLFFNSKKPQFLAPHEGANPAAPDAGTRKGDVTIGQPVITSPPPKTKYKPGTYTDKKTGKKFVVGADGVGKYQ